MSGLAQKPAQRPSHWKQAICRELRPVLEQKNAIRFAPVELAERFAFEHGAPPGPTFGFHGAFNLPLAMPESDLWWALERIPERLWSEGAIWRWVARARKAGRTDQADRLHRHCLEAFPEHTSGWPEPGR